MSEHVPTETEIKLTYMLGVHVNNPTVTTSDTSAEFDRWLEQHDREVAAKALIDELERLREVVATVKAITDGTPECDKYDDKSPVTCGWKFDLQRIKEVMK